MITALIMIPVMSASAPARGQCPARKSPTELEISLAYAQPGYNNKLSLEALKRLSKKSLRATHRPVGLTLATLQHKADIRFQSVTNSRTGETCTYLDRVRVHVSYVKTRVYIVRNYKPGSCQYKAVLEHENTHVRIYNETLSRARPSIRALIEKTLRAINPVKSAHPETARKSMQSRLKIALSASLKGMERKLSAAQKSIDTPGSYAKTRAKCRSW